MSGKSSNQNDLCPNSACNFNISQNQQEEITLQRLIKLFQSYIERDVIEMIWQNTKATGNSPVEILQSMKETVTLEVENTRMYTRKEMSRKDLQAIDSKQIAEKKPGHQKITTELQNGCKLLIIMRGASGSGKTTLAKKLKGKGIVLSTDDYFVNHAGQYVFRPEFLSEAHSWNQSRAKKNMENGISPIIIDNTNLEAWEMEPYICSAIRYSYEIRLVEPETPWKYNPRILAQKSQHGVPREKIHVMLEKWSIPINLDFIISQCKQKMFGYQRSSIPNNVSSNKDKMMPDKLNQPICNEVLNPLTSIEMLEGVVLDEAPSGNYVSNSLKEDHLESVHNYWQDKEKQHGPCEKHIGDKKKDVAIQASQSDPNYRILSTMSRNINPRIAANFSNWSTSKLTLDKGCNTEDHFDDCDRSRALRTLKSYFPSVVTQDLADVLEKCQGDLTWAFNVLLDSGYQCGDNDEAGEAWDIPEDDKAEGAIAQDTINKEHTNLDNAEPAADGPNEVLENPNTIQEVHMGQLMREETESLRKYIEECFVLTDTLSERTKRICGKNYDHFQAHYLQRSRQSENDSVTKVCAEGSHVPPMQSTEDPMFGNPVESIVHIKHENKLLERHHPDELETEEPIITMTLHSDFADKLASLFGNPGSDRKSVKNPVSFDIPWSLAEQIYNYWIINQYSEQMDQYKVQEEIANVEFQNMDFEYALQLAEEEKAAQHRELRDSMATKLSVQKLLDEFPHVDQLALEALFEANNYQYSNTVAALNTTYGAKPPLKETPSNSDFFYQETECENDPQCLRDEALVYDKKRQECSMKAKENFHRGLHAVATYYAQESRRYADLAKETNEKAALLIVEEKKGVHDNRTLDLHGLHVPEALSYLEGFISEKVKEGKTVIKIITGYGKHSFNSIPRIKLAVIASLRQKRLWYEELNPGMIRVHLKRVSR